MQSQCTGNAVAQQALLIVVGGVRAVDWQCEFGYRWRGLNMLGDE